MSVGVMGAAPLDMAAPSMGARRSDPPEMADDPRVGCMSGDGLGLGCELAPGVEMRVGTIAAAAALQLICDE